MSDAQDDSQAYLRFNYDRFGDWSFTGGMLFLGL